MARGDLPELQPSAGIDTSFAPDIQSSYLELSNVLRNFGARAGNFAVNLQAIQSEKAGEAAGSKNLKEKSDLPLTESARAFNKGLETAQSANLQLQLKSAAQTAKTDVLSPANFSPNALNNYKALYKATSEKILSDINPDLHETGENFASFYGQQEASEVNAHVQSLSRNQLQFQLFNYLHSTQNDINNLYRNGQTVEQDGEQVPVADAMLNQYKQKVDVAVENGLIGPSSGANLLQNAQVEGHENWYLGGFERAIGAGKPQEFLDKFLKSNISVFSPDQKTAVFAKMQGMLNQHNQQSKIAGDNISNDMDNAIALVKTGEPISSVQETLNRVKEFYPDAAPIFAQKLQNANMVAEGVQAIQYLSPIEANAQLQSMLPKKSDKDFANKLASLNTIQHLYQQDYSAFSKDPAGYVENSSIYKNTLTRAQTAKNTNGDIQQPIAPYSIDPDQVKISIEKNMGLSPAKFSILSNHEASSLVSNIQGMNMQDKLNMVDSVLSEHPGYENIALQDLRHAGLGMATPLLIGMQHNMSSIGQLPNAIIAFDTPTKELINHTTVKQNVLLPLVKHQLKDYYDSLANYNGLSPTAVNNITQHVFKLALLLSSKNGESASEAAEEAADVLINNQYNYDSIMGGTIRIPKVVGTQSLDSQVVSDNGLALLNAARRAKNLKIPPLYFPNLPTSIRREQFMDDVKANAHIVTSHDDSHLIIVDGNGVPLTVDGTTPAFTESFKNISQGKGLITKDEAINLFIKKQKKEQKQLLQGGIF